MVVLDILSELLHRAEDIEEGTRWLCRLGLSDYLFGNSYMMEDIDPREGKNG